MNADLPDDHSSDAQLDLHDPVWRLLASAPLRQPDAWFAARTLARCRQVRLNGEPAWMAFARIWRWTLGGVGVSLAIALVAVQLHFESTAHLQQKKVQEAFVVVASLGTDSDSPSTIIASPWQDSSP